MHSPHLFPVCKVPDMKKILRYETISNRTVLQQADMLIRRTEERVSRMLPSRFVLHFDGWKDKYAHYVAVFSMFTQVLHAADIDVLSRFLFS